MDRGYIKLWRKLQDNKAIYYDLNCLGVFIHLLFMAQWKSGYKVWFKGNQLELMPGQLTAGRKQLAISIGLSERNVRTCLKKLKNLKIVTIEPTSKFSLITILNWDTYQQLENENDQQSDQRVTSTRPASDQQVTTIKELKKERIKEVSNRPPSLETALQFFEDKTMGANFWDYYQSNGWKVGKNPMKDWKSAARRWIRQNQGVVVNAKREPKPFPTE